MTNDFFYFVFCASTQKNAAESVHQVNLKGAKIFFKFKFKKKKKKKKKTCSHESFKNNLILCLFFKQQLLKFVKTPVYVFFFSLVIGVLAR